MPRKQKAKKAEPKKAEPKLALKPQCAICTEPMMLKSVIPGAHIFPELRTYQCTGCGNLRSIEDESEPAIPEFTQAAA